MWLRMISVNGGSLVKTEKTLEGHKLLMRTISEMNATPVHRIFSIEELQVRSDKDSVLFQCNRAYPFAVISFWN